MKSVSYTHLIQVIETARRATAKFVDLALRDVSDRLEIVLNVTRGPIPVSYTHLLLLRPHDTAFPANVI